MARYYALNTLKAGTSNYAMSLTNGSSEPNMWLGNGVQTVSVRIGADGTWVPFSSIPAVDSWYARTVTCTAASTATTVELRIGANAPFARWELPNGVNFISGNSYTIKAVLEYYQGDEVYDEGTYIHWGTSLSSPVGEGYADGTFGGGGGSIITKIQSATSRISKIITKTQGASSRIRIVGIKTQTAVASIKLPAGLKTQTAISRILKLMTKSQTAIATITYSAIPTISSATAGKYGHITFTTFAAGLTTANVKIWHSVDNVTYIDVTASCLFGNVSAGVVSVKQLRPDKNGAPFGQPAYYKSSVGGGTQSPYVILTPALDIPAINEAKIAIIDANWNDTSNYWAGWGKGNNLLGLGCAYLKHPDQIKWKTRIQGQLAWLQSQTTSDGFLAAEHSDFAQDAENEWTSYVYRDGNGRIIKYAYMCSLLVRKVDSSFADTILTQVDNWAKAFVDVHTLGATTNPGWIYDQPYRPQNTVQVVGNMCKNISGTHQYYCIQAGTTANVADPSGSWSTITGATITDGTVVWKEDTYTTNITAHQAVINWSGSFATSTVNSGFPGGFIDPNQQFDTASWLAMLTHDSRSVFYSGTYRTKGDTVWQNELDSVLRATSNRGAVAYALGNNTTDDGKHYYEKYDTVYQSFATSSAALLFKILGRGTNPRLDWFIDKHAQYVTDVWSTEPVLGGDYSYTDHGTSPDAVEFMMRRMGFDLAGKTDPIGNLLYTAASNNVNNDYYDDFVQNGVTTTTSAYNNVGIQMDWFQYDAAKEIFLTLTYAPENVSLAVSGGNITITWDDVASDETGYEIQRQINEGSWSTITTTLANVGLYVDTPGAYNTLRYQVRTLRSPSNSDWAQSLVIGKRIQTATARIVLRVINNLIMGCNF